MLSTSTAFDNAFGASSIYPKAKIVVEFGSNRFNDNQVITSSGVKPARRGLDDSIQNATFDYWKADEAFNNKNRNTMKWLVLDRGCQLAATETGTGYRLINLDDTQTEHGWWSAAKSDGSGIFGAPQWVQSMFTARKINKIVLYTTEGYANMKEVTVDYHLSGGGWVTVAGNVTLGASTYINEWTVVGDPVIDGLRVYVNKTYSASDFARISEIQGIYETDISSDIISIDVHETRESYDQTVPVGTTQANELSFEVDNTELKYNIKNTSGPYYPYIGPNNKIKVYLGADVNQGVGTPSYEYVSMGEFWTDEWSFTSSMVASVNARDYSKFLQDEQLEFGRTWSNQNLTMLLYDLMARAGLASDQVLIDAAALRTYTILYLKDNSIWNFLTEISISDQGMFGFDRNGKFYYHSYNRLNTSPYDVPVYTFSYDSNIINGDIKTELYANRVVVHANPVATEGTGRRAIWQPESPNILGYALVNQPLGSADTTIYTINDLDEQAFPPTGYIWLPKWSGARGTDIIGGEIVKYNSRTQWNFTNCERGFADTPAQSFAVGDYIGEARVFDIEFDNAPALKVFYPFLTAIDSLERLENEGDAQAHILLWQHDAFNGRLIIGNLVNYYTWLMGTGLTFKDARVDNDNTNNTEIDFATIIAGEVLIEKTGQQQINKYNDAIAENLNYQRRYGKNEVIIDSPWIQSTAHAEAIANIMIDEYKSPRMILNLDAMGFPALELGDRVLISNYPQLNFTNLQLHVIGATYTYNGSLTTNYTLREVKA